jgi:Ca2+-binding RTX toxin-like protein
MHERHQHAGSSAGRRLLAGGALAVGLIAVTTAPAHAATTATFRSGVLTVTGDSAANPIAISRDAAGRILVNEGAVRVIGGSPTVGNTARVRVFGLGGDDTITLDEARGALPRATLSGGGGDDNLTGGSGADQLFGQAGNDTIDARGGNDQLFGGGGNDTLTGGDGSDLVFSQGGNDRMIRNAGEDTDLNEGGGGIDTVEVNGGEGAEQFTTRANGTRVRFEGVGTAAFTIDVGTSENLVLNAGGGDDSFATSGNLAALIKLTIDGGSGNDTLLGSNGIDLLLGGDGNDFLDGQQGNDVAFLGAGDDRFQWDPGDGSDTLEGQDGTDTMAFNGSNASEVMNIAASGTRVRFFRNIANIAMDLDGVESIVARTLGGADNVVVEDLTGTDAAGLVADLASPGGGDDGQPDNVIVNATNGDDAVTVANAGPSAEVGGLPAAVSVSGAVAGSDRLTVNVLAGDDIVDASGLAADSALLTVSGGDGDDVLIGGDGSDIILGGAGDDVLLGGPGVDTLDGGAGDNVVLQGFGADVVTSATVAGPDWLAARARSVKGKTVLTVNGQQRTLPRADLPELVRDVRAT